MALSTRVNGTTTLIGLEIDNLPGTLLKQSWPVNHDAWTDFCRNMVKKSLVLKHPFRRRIFLYVKDYFFVREGKWWIRCSNFIPREWFYWTDFLGSKWSAVRAFFYRKVIRRHCQTWLSLWWIIPKASKSTILYCSTPPIWSLKIV